MSITATIFFREKGNDDVECSMTVVRSKDSTQFEGKIEQVLGPACAQLIEIISDEVGMKGTLHIEAISKPDPTIIQ
jgi:hypothetical protein